MAEFGNSFKDARESRGLSIDDVAQETRISPRFLRAIEAEAFDELPGGVFNRGFIRSYAGKVGLDPSTMVEAYAALSSERPVEETREAPPAPTASAERFILPLAIGGLAVLALLFWIGFGGESRPPDSAPVTENRAARTIAEPASRSAETAPDTQVGAANAPVEDSTTIGQSTAPPPDEPAAADTSPPETVTEPSVIPPEAEPEALQDPGVAQETSDDASFNVRLEVLDSTRVYVALDGSVLYEDIAINPPFWRNYTVADALELRISDPSAISLTINGEPATRLGPAGAIWQSTITRENMGNLIDR